MEIFSGLKCCGLPDSPRVSCPDVSTLFISLSVGLFFNQQIEVLIASVALHWWTLAVLVALDAAVVARILVEIVYLIIDCAFSDSTRIFYYVNDLGWPIAAVLQGGLCLVARTVWLSGTLDNVKRALDIIFIMIMVRLLTEV